MTTVLNIVPINDLKEHIDTILCDCNPSLGIENMCCLVIHNAYDGRL